MKATEANRESKRPASHKWALFIFLALVAANIQLNVLGHFDVFGVIVTVASLAAFIASFAFARAHTTYRLCSVTLALVFLRSIESLWGDIAAYRAGLFHLPERWALLLIAFVCVAVVLLFLLVRAYTFGVASRQFYGLPITLPNRNA